MSALPSLWNPGQLDSEQTAISANGFCAWSDTHCKREQVYRLWVLGSDDLLQYQPELKDIWGDPDLKIANVHMERLYSVMPAAFLKSCYGIEMKLKPLPEGVSCPALRGHEVYRAVFSFLGALGSCGGIQCCIRALSYSESLRWTCKASWEKS